MPEPTFAPEQSVRHYRQEEALGTVLEVDHRGVMVHWDTGHVIMQTPAQLVALEEPTNASWARHMGDKYCEIARSAATSTMAMHNAAEAAKYYSIAARLEATHV